MIKTKKRVTAFVVVGSMLLSLALIALSGSQSNATTLQVAGNPPASNGDFTPSNTNNYEEATNTFTDGNPKYYLVTHDPAKKDLEKVTYKGQEYPLEGVTVVNSSDFNFRTLAFKNRSDDSTINLLDYNSPSKNFTLFFDDGTYNDTLDTNYTSLSKENASFIGLNKDGNGEPLATISRNPRTSTEAAINDKMERWLFLAPKIYIENLKFDGKGKDMYPVGQKGSSVPNNRGEFFFTINGSSNPNTDGFVMRNVILENIGADTSDSAPFWGIDERNKNVAINVLYNPGKVNIEDVKIRNIKTTIGYGTISTQQASKTFFRNITIDSSAAHPDSRSIKVEHSNATYVPINENKVTFAGELNLGDSPMKNHIYVQDYRYAKVTAPENFKYAVWNIRNGGTYTASSEIHKELPATTSGKAIQDFSDNYWIVNANSTVTIDKQLSDILSVINYSDQRSPQANIKLVTNSTIPSFTLPAGFAGKEVNIVAVKNSTDQYDSKALVPVAADATITLPENNNAKLYNFDFHENAKLTIHEAIEGITALAEDQLKDPLQTSDVGGADYPKYETYGTELPKTPRVTNANKDTTFVNCKFTVLAETVAIDNVPEENTLKQGKDHQLAPKFDKGYSIKGLDGLTTDSIDDKNVIWVSSDNTIAEVTADGLVKPVGLGEVIIYLKAIDANNNGEIEKPFASITLKVTKDEPIIPVDPTEPEKPIGPEKPTVPTKPVPPAGAVTKVAKLSDTPKTGDASNPAGILLISSMIVGVAALSVNKLRKN